MSSNPHDAPTVAREVSGLCGDDALTRVYVRADGPLAREPARAGDAHVHRTRRKQPAALLQTMTVRAVAALSGSVGGGAHPQRRRGRKVLARGWFWIALMLGSAAIGSATAVLSTLALRPNATARPIPSPSPIPSPIPSPTPIPTPSPIPSPIPSPTPIPTPIPTRIPSPRPNSTPLPYPIPNPSPILSSAPPSKSARAAAVTADLTAPLARGPTSPAKRRRVPRATPASAADQLVAGDYPAALDSYRQLASLHPDDPAFATIARMLERDLTRRCDPARASHEAPCTP